MDKEKQIEEMTTVIANTYLPVMQGVTTVGEICLGGGDAWRISNALYNAGCRKQKEDTVEVVRCKDCKFNVANMEKDPSDITDYSGDDIVCSYFMTDGLEPTDFCSYGVRKGGAE